jgi:hypothetical protein
LAIYTVAKAGEDEAVARIIQFYVPASFRKKAKAPITQPGRLIKFVKKSA